MTKKRRKARLLKLYLVSNLARNGLDQSWHRRLNHFAGVNLWLFRNLLQIRVNFLIHNTDIELQKKSIMLGHWQQKGDLQLCPQTVTAFFHLLREKLTEPSLFVRLCSN